MKKLLIIIAIALFAVCLVTDIIDAFYMVSYALGLSRQMYITEAIHIIITGGFLLFLLCLSSPNLRRGDQIEDQPPFGIAGFTCLICDPLIYWFTEPSFAQYASSSVRHWIYILAPPVATFMVLFLTDWRRDLPTTKRIIVLIYRACIIYGIVILFCIAMFVGLFALGMGQNPRTY